LTFAIGSLINKIEREQFESGPASDEMLSLLAAQLMITACRFSGGKNKKSEKLCPGLENAMTYIQNNYRENILLETLSEKACMSKRTFLRYFLKATGYSPIQYLLKIRISRACQILRESDMPLYEVSGFCGFRDSNYFSRSFKNSTGMTAKEFRGKVSAKIN
jgi:transcriptional regulator GlxA family with amidase domain